jgi:hypothetical protein
MFKYSFLLSRVGVDQHLFSWLCAVAIVSVYAVLEPDAGNSLELPNFNYSIKSCIVEFDVRKCHDQGNYHEDNKLG